MAQHFFIDGYNLLFHLLHRDSTDVKWLENRRNQLITSLKTLTKAYSFTATLFFDGSYSTNLELARYTVENLEILYTPSKQTVDQLLLGTTNSLKHLCNPHTSVLVTSDHLLASYMRPQVHTVMNSEEFVTFIRQKGCKKQKSLQNEKALFLLSPASVEAWVTLFSENKSDY